jgi:hypothetical protein
VAESIEQLSFELTANALAEQERALSGLRTRAGTVLAAASIAGSFLGAKVSHGSLDTWGILAMISFASCLASAIWILLPTSLSSPSTEGAACRERSSGGARCDGGIPRCGDLDRAAPGPQPRQDRRTLRLAGCECALLAVEVILWTISLIG